MFLLIQIICHPNNSKQIFVLAKKQLLNVNRIFKIFQKVGKIFSPKKWSSPWKIICSTASKFGLQIHFKSPDSERKFYKF